jgi:hypothetical protein
VDSLVNDPRGLDVLIVDSDRDEEKPA